MKYTVKKKLVFSFSLIIIIIFLFGIYSLIAIKNEKDNSNNIVQVCINKSNLANNMAREISDHRIKEYKYVVAQDKTLMNNTENEMITLEDDFETTLSNYETTAEIGEDREFIDKIKSEYNKYIKISKEILVLRNNNKDIEATNLLYKESKDNYDKLNTFLSQLVQFNDKQADLANLEINNIYAKSRLIIIILLLLIIVICIVISSYIITTINRSVQFLSDFLNKTAKLDLILEEEKLKNIKQSNDEFYEMSISLVKMRNIFRELIINIKGNSLDVSSNADNLSSVIDETSQIVEGIAKAVEDMAQGSVDLARNTEDGANKLIALSNEMDQVLKSTDLIRDYIKITSDTNIKGLELINKLKLAVESNTKISEKMIDQVNILNNKSEDIERITDTIKAITAQINLLSLNAAIEAAKAGKQGQGFAVVADEIRKLATETSYSTKEIENIVRDVKNEIEITKVQMSKAESSICETSKVSLETEKAFNDIDSSVYNIISQIESLIKNIDTTINNKNIVLANITSISAIAEQSAATTEEISASVEEQVAGIDRISKSAKELKEISKELEQLISKFRT